MAPALQPGDWLLVDPEGYRRRPPRTGELVVVPDPRLPERELIKRVSAIEPGGRLHLAGDAPEASTDSRTFGSVATTDLAGRPWFRYWPLGRVGRVR